MQTGSSTIWTRVVVSITYEDNHYTSSYSQGESKFLLISESWCVHVYESIEKFLMSSSLLH